MSDLVVETPEGVALRHELAGAGSRFAAGVIDLAVLAFVWLALMSATAFLAGVDPTGLSGVLAAFLGAGMIVIFVGFQVVVPLLWEGQTIGKRALGLRVADAEGWPAAPSQHLMRGLFWLVDALLFACFFLPPGVILIALTPRRQRLGDLVAGTVVVRTHGGVLEPEPWPKESWSALDRRTVELAPAHAARLDARDLAYLRTLLTRQGLQRPRRRELYVQTARTYAQRLGLGPFQDARTFLKELYLFAREMRRADDRS